MSLRPSTTALVLVTALSTGCFVRGGAGLFFLAADTALVTAVVISATRPPPPRIVYMPAPRPGFGWQPGYWTLNDGQWSWVDGGWVELRPGYDWSPAHWQERPDHNWELVPGQWVPQGSPPPAPPPPPGTPPPLPGYTPAPSGGAPPP